MLQEKLQGIPLPFATPERTLGRPLHQGTRTPLVGTLPSIWLYLHRTGADTLHSALRDHAEPKLRFKTDHLATLQSEAGDSPAPSQRRAINAQQTLVDELATFCVELGRVAPLWNPDLDDGVLINASFLHRLFAHTRSWQKECEEHWASLQADEYDWSHLSIAHGLEAMFWQEIDGKWKPLELPTADVERFVKNRTSPAVKDALAQLGSAPQPAKARAPRKSTSSAPEPIRAPAPAPTQLSLGLTATVADPAVLDTVREALHRFPDGAGKVEILASTGIDESAWKPAIDALVAPGDVVRTSHKLGTKYNLVVGA